MSRSADHRVLIRKPKLVFRASVQVAQPTSPANGCTRVRGPLGPEQTAAMRAQHGIPDVCAHCTRWYEGLERTRRGEDPVCSSTVPCGGVVASLGYPNYDGPFTDEYMQSHCVVCGADAREDKSRTFKVVTTPDGLKRCYCDTDLQMLMSIRQNVRGG